MKKDYMKRLALFCGAAALVSSAFAQETAWSNVTGQYLKNPAFIPNWCGALTNTGEGVGEVYEGAFDLYQVVNDAPAGKYTLTVNAFYRVSHEEGWADAMKDGANHNAYIYLNDKEQAVEGLADKHVAYPNGMAEANTAFADGLYLNTVSIDHKGGDLRLGIKSYGGRVGEWCCFDNFKLQGPDGEVAVPNGDFAQGIDLNKEVNVWDMTNSKGDVKTPDVNKGGGVYRKTNASPYAFEQELDLPAGTYRWGVQSFVRNGNGGGNVEGKYIHCKGNTSHAWTEGTSSLDLHKSGADKDLDPVYIYVDDAKKNIPCLYDVEMEKYPDNLWPVVDGVFAVSDYGFTSVDSGNENEAARMFVNNPNLYRTYVEFTVPEGGKKVYVGFGKDSGSGEGQYWNPFRDFTLERQVASAAVDGLAADAEGEAEYYNLQGVRVGADAKGLLIIKKGNKATKALVK